MSGDRVWVAETKDCVAIGRLLHAFNREYDDPTPGPEALAARVAELMESGDTAVLLAGQGSACVGLSLVRFRPGLWSEALEAYLAELYVVPSRRGHGLGRALLETTIALSRERGADRIELGTSEDDRIARALYESAGFVNREHPPDGPVMYVYERDL